MVCAIETLLAAPTGLQANVLAGDHSGLGARGAGYARRCRGVACRGKSNKPGDKDTDDNNRLSLGHRPTLSICNY